MIDLADTIEGLDPSHIGTNALLLADACAQLDRLQAIVVEAVGVFDAQGLWALDNAVNMTGWLKATSFLSGTTAGSWTALARRLRDLPGTTAALRDGRLSCDQAKVIARAVSARLVPAFLEDEEALLPDLATLSVSDLGRAMAEWAARVQAVLDDGPRPEESRRLDLSQVGDEWILDATLTPEGGQLVAEAIRQATSRDAEGELRTAKQKRADALTDVCRWFLTHRTDPPKNRRRPHLDVGTSLDDLTGHGAGRTTDGAIIDPVTLQRLACDSTVSAMLLSSRSHVIAYGLSQRTVTDTQFKVLIKRDRHCRWPGCDRTPDWCEAHHLRHWTNGGPTDIDNLCLFCSRHHHVLHQPEWTIKFDPSDASLHITTPTGHVMISRPPALTRPSHLFDTC